MAAIFLLLRAAAAFFIADAAQSKVLYEVMPSGDTEHASFVSTGANRQHLSPSRGSREHPAISASSLKEQASAVTSSVEGAGITISNGASPAVPLTEHPQISLPKWVRTTGGTVHSLLMLSPGTIVKSASSMATSRFSTTPQWGDFKYLLEKIALGPWTAEIHFIFLCIAAVIVLQVSLVVPHSKKKANGPFPKTPPQ